MNGKVYLVGGGPGAIELYTLKAIDCIQKADCLLYDRLIDPQILEYTKPECECIYVGKKSSQHTLPQDKINQLLVEKAHQYQYVVRLKGGDVYVFGRGGEEALALYENHSEFEVVPGLSSSIAGLSYGGVPITHRGLSSGFMVVTAHHQNEKEWDYHRFLNDDLTYVFMMGLSELPTIVENLLKAGKKSETPIALISHATLKNQTTLYGELANILDKVKKQPMVSPMLIVVGAVVSLHNQLNFYERKPFFRKKVLVTTVTNQRISLTKYFDEQGAFVKQLQVGEISYQLPHRPVNFKQSVIVFTSQNGIKGFFNWLKETKCDYRQLSDTRFACIGEKTAKLLYQYGFMSDLIAHEANSEAFNEDLKTFLKADERMIVVSHKEESSIERKTDRDLFLSVYDNQERQVDENDSYDLVCFTCASSVERLSKQNCLIKNALSIGPMTSRAIRKYYPNVKIIEADENSYQGMIKKIEVYKDVL